MSFDSAPDVADAVLQQAINGAALAGIPVVVAAGNNAMDVNSGLCT
jgi:hypothetical protein